MLQLKDETPFKSLITLFPNEQGIDSLYIVVKASFILGERIRIAEDQVAPIAADEYWGEPGKSSVKYASDIHLTKPGTDVVMVGQAWSPERKTPQIDVSLNIADKLKTIRVFGHRQWQKDGSITNPEPFESMQMVYERAYGGYHQRENEPLLAEGRNPIGVGFMGKRKTAEMAGLPAPNIEDPKQCIRRLGDQPAPAGFGYIAPSWLPRREFAGTYDQTWQKKRAPYLPVDFDPRFFHAAHPELVFDQYLKGGEPVEITNASAEGPIRFNLPVCELRAEVQIAGHKAVPELNMESILIEPDLKRLCMLWRGALPCDKKTLQVEQVKIQLHTLQGVEGAS